MIRVLHYIPGFAYGGIESLYLDWYRNINKDDFSFELLLRTQDDDAPALVEYRKLGGSYYRLPRLSFNRIVDFRRGVIDFFKWHQDYDILHVHCADPFVLGTAKPCGVRKVIIHSHTTSVGKDRKQHLLAAYERVAIRRYADRAAACSELAARWKFGGMHFKGKDVVIVKNGIDTEAYRFSPEMRARKREELGLTDSYVIGHVGRMTAPKNQYYLFDIFSEFLSKVPDAILLMVGDGPDEDGLRRYASELGVDESVRFLGQRDDVSELLQAMDCFLLPSRWEGLPVTLVEAQAAGLPCVISDVVTTEVDVTDCVYRMSITQNTAKWADKLMEVRESYNRVDRSAEVALAGFDTRQSVWQLEKLYTELCIGEI